MELFTKAKLVKLRSHLHKYLLADDDQETVRQSRDGAGIRSLWLTEPVNSNKDGVFRLKSCSGTYLTASNEPFLLGMTGHRVVQSVPEGVGNWNLDWEFVKHGSQWKLKSWCGTYLRANGGTPPWRNSVTHDEPHTGATKRWIVWDIEGAEVLDGWGFSDGSIAGVAESEYSRHDSESPSSVESWAKQISMSTYSWPGPKKSLQQRKEQVNFNCHLSGMEFFHNAKAVRLRSHHGKYLMAEEDEESVIQDRKGSSKAARWTVEFLSDHVIRLKSCYGKYLTATRHPFLLGMTGRKVLQTLPHSLDYSVQWEPVRDGNQVKLRTRQGNFLRANGGLPPWRNSVTHDTPHMSSTHDWVFWDVDVLEILVRSPAGVPVPKIPPVPRSDSVDFQPISPPPLAAVPGSFSRQELSDSFHGSPPKSEGRTVYYHIADENGDVDDGDEAMKGFPLSFKGNGVDELTQKLREETGLKRVVVCTRSPLDGKLHPLRLQLPPNNANMRVVVVPLAEC